MIASKDTTENCLKLHLVSMLELAGNNQKFWSKSCLKLYLKKKLLEIASKDSTKNCLKLLLDSMLELAGSK